MVAKVPPGPVPLRRKDRDEEPLFKRRGLALAKRSARSIVRARPDERRVLLIFGCQRSGTTMLQQTFLDRSWRVLILEEHDRRLVGPAPGPEETAGKSIPPSCDESGASRSRSWRPSHWWRAPRPLHSWMPPAR